MLSIETLVSFRFLEPASTLPHSGAVHECRDKANDAELIHSPDITTDSVARLYVLTFPDGSLHNDSTLYSIHRIKSRPDCSDHTLRSIASNLKDYLQFCLDNGLDYLKIPDQERKRPTFRYASYLRERLEKGEISPPTLNHRISAMADFYRWLIQQSRIRELRDLPFEDIETSIKVRSAVGYTFTKQGHTTNLHLKATASPRNSYSSFIRDGGHCKPLTADEERSLIQATVRAGNTEMTLIIAIALSTGMRLQSICTLRRKHFKMESEPRDKTHRINIGPGTGVDTKFNKRMTVSISDWLFQKIRIYMHSSRARHRLHKADSGSFSEDDQYVFLTSHGKPFYMAKNDPLNPSTTSPPKGNTVRNFITNLKFFPAKKEAGQKVDFRFHDLRATYGLRLTEYLQQTVRGKTDQHWVIQEVAKHMGHSNTNTTLGYINYQSEINSVLEFQKHWEESFEMGGK